MMMSERSDAHNTRSIKLQQVKKIAIKNNAWAAFPLGLLMSTKVAIKSTDNAGNKWE
jgi:hypothetical protein